jgi:hypothetical protein
MEFDVVNGCRLSGRKHPVGLCEVCGTDPERLRAEEIFDNTP